MVRSARLRLAVDADHVLLGHARRLRRDEVLFALRRAGRLDLFCLVLQAQGSVRHFTPAAILETTMKRIYGAFLLGASILFAGCDQVGKHVAALVPAKPITLVFPPGYQVAIASQPVGVYGFDVCPKQAPFMKAVFGSAPNEDSTDCIVVAPTTKTVKVKLALPAGIVAEEWTVRRGVADQLHLMRPNGQPVVSFEAHSKL